jgi:C1A family cysteine protease
MLAALVFIAIFGVIASSGEHVMTNKILENFMEGSPKELFKVWHFLHEKTYTLDTQEARERFAAFKANLKLIKEHNAQNSDYKLGLNEFSDMSNTEFTAKMCTKKVVKGAELEKLISDLNMKPANFLEEDDDDLTKRNLAYANIDHSAFFNTARNQGNCGSCWAFSTAGTIEGFLAKNKYNSKMNYLSTQQLVDCDTGNYGCNGGNFGPAYAYVQTNGLQYDTTYVYTQIKSSCKYNKTYATNTIRGFTYCSNYGTTNPCTVDKVYNLLRNGPVSVGIDGSVIQSYIGGIYTGLCSADNHAVILVGYGYDTVALKEYWLVRNSWGSNWGLTGYIKIHNNPNNKNSCYVANEGYQPTL